VIKFGRGCVDLLREAAVMKGVILSAVVIVALMAAIKDGRALRTTGLTGGCTAVAAPSGQADDWQRCTAGKLQGAPDLSRQGCTVGRSQGKTQYWRCPARIDSAPGT
jgi:hypothetical protein